jgi:hypothetical protein
VGFQLHDLSHSLQSLQTSRQENPLPSHTPACEQCLVFAAMDGVMPTHGVVLPPTPSAAVVRTPVASSAHSAAFTAYASRAPPSRC